jgi:hypothetical protein
VRVRGDGADARRACGERGALRCAAEHVQMRRERANGARVVCAFFALVTGRVYAKRRRRRYD